MFCVGAIRETVSLDVPSDANVSRAEMEHGGSSKDFGVIIFVFAEEAWVGVCVLHYFFLLFLCFLTFRNRGGRGCVRPDAFDRRWDVHKEKGSLLEAEGDVFKGY